MMKWSRIWLKKEAVADVADTAHMRIFVMSSKLPHLLLLEFASVSVSPTGTDQFRIQKGGNPMDRTDRRSLLACLEIYYLASTICCRVQ
jgi:hypothetical protein